MNSNKTAYESSEMLENTSDGYEEENDLISEKAEVIFIFMILALNIFVMNAILLLILY